MKKAICTLLLAVLSVWASAPTLIVPPSTLTVVETEWAAVPTSPTAVCNQTIWLDQIVFSSGADARTITAVDAQGSPVTWMTAVSISANQIVVISFPRGVRMQGGFTISASGSWIVYQFKGRVNR